VPIPADLKFWKMRGDPLILAYLFLNYRRGLFLLGV
jgi:hypothetical protein